MNTHGAVWTPTGEDHHEFLWHFVVEAVFGGDIGAGANDVDADGFRRSWQCISRLTCLVRFRLNLDAVGVEGDVARDGRHRGIWGLVGPGSVPEFAAVG